MKKEKILVTLFKEKKQILFLFSNEQSDVSAERKPCSWIFITKSIWSVSSILPSWMTQEEMMEVDFVVFSKFEDCKFIYCLFKKSQGISPPSKET